MTVLDYIIIALILFLTVLAVIKIIKRKGSCSGCSKNCAGCQKFRQKKEKTD